MNLIQATLLEALGYEICLPILRRADFIYDKSLCEGIKFPYRLKTLYVDLDGTLVFEDGALNYELIGYIFGLKVNCNTRIVLITQHQKKSNDTLRTLGLFNQFDKVTYLNKGESKADYVTGSCIAFVDDSYAERNAVSLANPDALCIGPEGQRVLSGFLTG